MGLLRQGDKILLVNHSGLNEINELWLPPGGGVNYKESIKEALIREFQEEVNISVKICDFLGFYEFISGDLHAIEFFFDVEQIGGKLQLGHDPEMGQNSILKEAYWVDIQMIKKLDQDSLHWLFRDIQTIDDLFDKQVFFNLRNNP